MSDTFTVVVFFAVTGAIFNLLEERFPIQPVNRRLTLMVDTFTVISSLALSGLFVLAPQLLLPVPIEQSPLVELPIVVQFLVFFILADLSKYCFHVLMHQNKMWATHRFHHSPHELYWMSGNRASIINLFIHFFPLGILSWYLQLQVELILLNNLLNVIWNHLMHANLKIPDFISRKIEWFVVTPRYHRLHHSLDLAVANTNYASILTVWDRLFKTYFNPDHLAATHAKFGDGSSENDRFSWRMFWGY